MGHLDSYDQDGIVKWHHFAFRADAGRVRELRQALEAWTSWRDRAALEAFVAKYREDWLRRFAEDRAGPVAPALFGPLVENAGVADIDVAVVKEKIARYAPVLTKLMVDRLRALPRRLERLARLRALDAPEVVVAAEIEGVRDTLLFRAMEAPADEDAGAGDQDGAHGPGGAPAPQLDFRGLFETAIELAVADPWEANAGLWRMLEAVEGAPVPAGISLVDEEWPVHHENLEGREACVYGFEGFDILVTFAEDDRDELLDERAAMDAYEVDDHALRRFALDRLERALVDEDAWTEPGDDVDEDEDEDDGDRYERVRRRHAERLAPDRVASFVQAARDEWRERMAVMRAAVDDVVAGRCALLQWSAKNPAL